MSIDRATSYQIMDSFLEHGGNFIDTAKIYSDWIPGEYSRSEKVIGEWLKMRGNRQRVILATKGAHPHLESMLTPRLSPAEIISDLEASLSHLQTDCIDLYWLHRDDIQRPVAEILDTLKSQVKAGKTRAYGASNWSRPRLEAAQEYAASQGIPGFVGVQNLWNLAHIDFSQISDPTLVIMDEDLLDYHKRTHLPAIPYTSQANGLFQKMDQGRMDQIKAMYLNPTTEARYARLKILHEQTGLSTTQIVLAYLTSQPFPTLPVIGPHSLAQLEDSLTAADVTLTPEQVEMLRVG